jgi:Ribbon-helix-helix protein, copG family
MNTARDPGPEPAAGGATPAAALPPPEDARVVTSLSLPASELERLDAVARALGVDRGRLLRAAALWVTHERTERVRLWLSRLPRNREWRERLLDVLSAEEWVELGELSRSVGARRESFRAALDRLVDDGLVARSGLGRRGSPLRFRRTREGERRRGQLQRRDYERAAAARIRARGY